MDFPKYKLDLSLKIKKDLEKISKETRKKIYERLENLAVNPKPANCKPLTGNLKGLFRVRHGDYRIIYSINDTKLVILILKIGHRKDVYEDG